MASGAKANCVVLGAGALGLGFLGPELSPDCRITYLDIPAKAALLDRLKRSGSYVFNETGLSMRPVTVAGVDGLCLGGEGAGQVQEALDAADLVFTAVGERNLSKVAPLLASAAQRRPAGRPLRILCAENGVEIALNLRKAIEKEAGRALGDLLLVGDTVMGRMCKIVQELAPPVEPPGPGLDWAVVAEPFFGIPVEEHAVAGLPDLPAAFDSQPPERFHASEDVKMLAHNGLHAMLACWGYLKGVEHFDELRDDAEAMELARLLADEAGTALSGKHGAALPRSGYLNYCDSILRRVTCPVFHDTVARGVRGIMRKLEPDERLVYSVRTVREQGIEPVAFAAGLAAAVLVARRSGETDLDFRDVLTQHCGFDADRDAELLSLIEGRRASLDGRRR